MFLDGKSLAQARREYGIKNAALSQWKHEFIKRSPNVFETHNDRSDRDEGIATLERLVGRMAMEHEEMARKVSNVMGPPPSINVFRFPPCTSRSAYRMVATECQ